MQSDYAAFWGRDEDSVTLPNIPFKMEFSFLLVSKWYLSQIPPETGEKPWSPSETFISIIVTWPFVLSLLSLW